MLFENIAHIKEVGTLDTTYLISTFFILRLYVHVHLCITLQGIFNEKHEAPRKVTCDSQCNSCKDYTYKFKAFLNIYNLGANPKMHGIFQVGKVSESPIAKNFFFN